MINNILFISDLHLSASEPKITKLFASFCEQITPQTDAIYILGDFFKFWAGDDNRSEFNEKIKELLKTISKKTQVYLMSGNRDFILGQDFAKESGCFLISDPYKIDLYGKPTLLTHGDILCTNNVKYRVFRSIIKIPYGIKIFLKLPLKFRIWFASSIQKYSAKSKFSQSRKESIPQIKIIKTLMDKYNTNQIIHGHIHRIEDKEFSVNEQKIHQLSLGVWEKCGSVLVYYQNSQYEFKQIT
jgi:UDP-2,3-diacylglucosamine hydrolase